MKIHDLRSKKSVGLGTLSDGEVFQFCNTYYIAGMRVGHGERQCTDLNSGVVIHYRISPPETMVMRVPNAKLVIED